MNYDNLFESLMDIGNSHELLNSNSILDRFRLKCSLKDSVDSSSMWKYDTYDNLVETTHDVLKLLFPGLHAAVSYYGGLILGI